MYCCAYRSLKFFTWLKPKVKSLKFFIGAYERYFSRILLHSIGDHLETLEYSGYDNLLYTKDIYSTLRLGHNDQINRIDLSLGVDELSRHQILVSSIRSCVQAIFGSAIANNMVKDADFLSDGGYSLPEISTLCPKLRHYKTNKRVPVECLPITLQKLTVLHPPSDLSRFTKLKYLSIKGVPSHFYEACKRFNVNSPTLEELDLRDGIKNLFVTCDKTSMPNLKVIRTRGDGFGTFPKAIINNCQYWGRERGERELQSLPENIPLPQNMLYFTSGATNNGDGLLHEGHDPDICNIANGCTIISYSWQRKEFSYSQEKGLTIFRYCQYCKGTSDDVRKLHEVPVFSGLYTSNPEDMQILLCSDCYKPWIRDAGKVLDYHNVIETGLKNKWTKCLCTCLADTSSQDFLDTCEREFINTKRMPYCLCPAEQIGLRSGKYLSSVHSHGGEGKIREEIQRMKSVGR